MIEINIEGIEQMQRHFARLVPETQKQVLDGLAQTAFDTAQHEVGKHVVTGALERSLSLKPEGTDAWIIGHDTQHAPHAIFVHFGARAHVIRPKERQALRWPGGNGFIFAKWVKHPGYAGDPWLETAKQSAIRAFADIVRRVRWSDQ